MTNFMLKEVKAQNVRDNEIITAEYWNSIFGIESYALEFSGERRRKGLMDWSKTELGG
jgi:hypothetical protein